MYNKILEFLIEKRIALGMNKLEFSKYCGITSSHLSKIELRQRTINLDTLERILTKLNADIEIIEN